MRAMILGCHYRMLGLYNKFIAKNVKLTDKYQNQSALEFKKAQKLQPNYPELAIQMMYTREWQNKETWFKRALEIEFDNFNAFIVYTRSFPPGSGAWMKLIGECVEFNRHNSYVSYHALAMIMASYQRNKGFLKETNMYQSIKKLLIGMANAKNRSMELYYSKLIAFALKFEEYADARTYINKLGINKVNVKEIDKLDLDASLEMAFAFAIKGRAGGIAKEARAYLNKPFLSKKEVIDFKQLISEGKDIAEDKRALPFYAICEQKLNTREEIDSGEWVKLKFDKNFNNWRKKGSWKYIDENTVEMLSTGKTETSLTYLSSIKPPYEIKFETAHSNVKNEKLGTEIILGKGLVLWLLPANKTAKVIDKASNDISNIHTPPKIGKVTGNKKHFVKFKNKITLIVYQNYYEFYINGGLVNKFEMQDIGSVSSLGLSTGTRLAARGKVRFSNLKFRKLNSKQPDFNDYEKSMAYINSQIKKYPKCQEWFIIKAKKLIEVKRFDEAIIEYKNSELKKLAISDEDFKSLKSALKKEKAQFKTID